LIYQKSIKTVYKLVAGIAFRNPSAFEQYYDDQGVSQAPNSLLRPEKIQTVEAALEHQINKRVNAVATVYRYWLRDLIEAVPFGEGIVQYQNVSRYSAKGAEMELNGTAWKGLQGAASVALEDLSKASGGTEWPANSPRVIAKVRLAVPLDRGRFSIAGTFQSMSARRTLSDFDVRPVTLTNLTMTSSRLHPDFDVQFGVRNLLDQKAWDPASPGQGVYSLARDGRSAFVKLVWHTRQ
jgi:outer membrane receptor protein involved in Fe transport